MAVSGVIRLVVLAGVACLAACAAPPKGTTQGGSAAVAPMEAPGPSTDEPAVEANVPVESLLHIRTSELRSRFGDPHAQRRDGGAVVWNYEADGVCRLNLVLQGVRGATPEVVHAQARMAPGGSEDACFDRLRQEARVSTTPVDEAIAPPAVVSAPGRGRAAARWAAPAARGAFAARATTARAKPTPATMTPATTTRAASARGAPAAPATARAAVPPARPAATPHPVVQQPAAQQRAAQQRPAAQRQGI